jgi:membrane associated rhomboid family serine protease
VYFLWQPSPFGDTGDANFDIRHAAIPLEIRQRAPLSRCQVFDAFGSPTQATAVCASPGAQQPYAPGKDIWLAIAVSMFLHASLWHLGGNMLFLCVFGNNVEDRLGSLWFALFYVAAGLVAFAAQFLSDPSSAGPVLGASGAIAGVMGAYLVWYPRARILSLVFIIILPVPAWLLLIAWFALQFFTSPSSGVAWVAHVGGFAFGVLIGLLLRPRRPPLRPATQWPPPTRW